MDGRGDLVHSAVDVIRHFAEVIDHVQVFVGVLLFQVVRRGVDFVADSFQVRDKAYLVDILCRSGLLFSCTCPLVVVAV